MTTQKREARNPNAIVEVDNNLIILKAKSEVDAVKKAIKIGLLTSGDSRSTLSLDGKPAITKFIGVRDIGLIDDEPNDGSEILWERKRTRKKYIPNHARTKKSILSILRKKSKGQDIFKAQNFESKDNISLRDEIKNYFRKKRAKGK